MQVRRVPRFVYMTRDFYHSFFGLRTAVTFMYGIIEQGTFAVAPVVGFLILARRKHGCGLRCSILLGEEGAL